jgi:uncharacterized protein (TIRG00374 family)
MKTFSLNNWRRNIFGIVLSCACLGFILWQINMEEVWGATSHFQWSYLFAGVASLMFGYTMRIVRWSSILRAAGAKVSPTICAAPFLGSIALNNILPARLGDVIRALIFPSAINVGKITATGSLIIERLVDLTTLLACLLIGLILNSKTQLPIWMANTAISLAIVGGISLILIFLFSAHLSRKCAAIANHFTSKQNTYWNRFFVTLRDLLESVNAMSRVPVLISVFTISMLVWAGETGLFWFLLKGFELDTGPAMAITVMAIVTLSTLIPSSPGYVGPFHLAAYAAIAMLGGTRGQAASFAVLSHLGIWLPGTLVGSIALLANPQLFSGIKTKAELTSQA